MKQGLRLGLLAATMLAGPALAQDAPLATADKGAIDEIVVTAQRREERLQDVPISITALSGEDIIKLNVRDVADSLAFAPNVAVTSGPTGGNSGGFFIRGIGQYDNSIAVDPGVGVYVDEIYIARLQASSFSLIDIERIEVLRGPQGTLFGRNTIGGAVSITTAGPAKDLAFTGRVIAGPRDRIDVAASASIPFGDDGGIRLTGFTRNQNGRGKNVYTGDTFGDVHDWGGRLKALWAPGDVVKVQLTGDYIQGRGSPLHQRLLGFNPASGIVVPRPPMFGGPFFRPGVSPTGVPFPIGVGADRSDRLDDNFFSIPARIDTDNGGVSAMVSADLGAVTVKSITGWRRYVERANNDFDSTGFVLYDASSYLKQTQFSQELQASGNLFSDRLRFLVGGYYFNEDIFTRIELCTGSSAPRFTRACLLTRNEIGLKVESAAAFGQLELRVTDTLSLVGGLRYTSETKRQNFLSILDNTLRAPTVLPPIAVPAPGTVRTVLPFTQVEDTFEATTPRVAVNWSPKRDVLLYVSYAEGFKSGGFTGRPSSAAVVPFDPETVRTVEGGFKTELFDRKLRLNFAAFSSEYKNIQLLVFTPISGLFDTANAGDATISGVEVEAAARLGGRILVNGSLGWLDAGYDRLRPDVAGVDLDDRLPVTPEWTWNLGGQYTLPLGGSRSLMLRADYIFRSTVSYQIENDPLEIEPGYGLLNLRATFTATDWLELSAVGTNVTNKTFYTQRLDSRNGNGVAFGSLGRPAEWALEARLRF